MRGMARRRGAWPGFRQTGPIARASPERRALALMTRAPAPLGAPPRHRFRFRVVRRPDPHGALVPHGGCPAAARGCGCIGHTRRCRVPPHFVRRLGRSAPQSTGLSSQIVNVTHKSMALVQIFRRTASSLAFAGAGCACRSVKASSVALLRLYSKKASAGPLTWETRR